MYIVECSIWTTSRVISLPLSFCVILLSRERDAKHVFLFCLSLVRRNTIEEVRMNIESVALDLVARRYSRDPARNNLSEIIYYFYSLEIYKKLLWSQQGNTRAKRKEK